MDWNGQIIVVLKNYIVTIIIVVYIFASKLFVRGILKIY